MNDKEKIEILLKALMFYVNPNVYWSEPLPLEANYHRETLRIANMHHDSALIIQDWGQTAARALIEVGEATIEIGEVYRSPRTITKETK